MLELSVFGLGCLLGLIVFSKLLRYLLAVHRPLTMSVLCGVMVGALNKLWPFQAETLVGSGEHQVPHYQNVLPASLNLQTVAVILSGLVAVLIILWLDRQFTTGSRSVHDVPAQQNTDD